MDTIIAWFVLSLLVGSLFVCGLRVRAPRFPRIPQRKVKLASDEKIRWKDLPTAPRTVVRWKDLS